RTPLNAILGWATLARNSRFDEEHIEKALSIIERNARNQSQIIADVLDVSRIITGKFNLEVRSVELISILESAIDTMRPAIDARRIWLRRDFDTQETVVMGDANRLQQVFWNLLSNAVKFTPEGGIINVGLRHIDQHVMVTVRDNGEGITPEFLPFVF